MSQMLGLLPVNSESFYKLVSQTFNVGCINDVCCACVFALVLSAHVDGTLFVKL